LPAKFNCFLSASFRRQDERLLAFFRNLLEQHFNVLCAKADNNADLLDKILPQIRASEVVFAIFSCRNRIGDDMIVPPDVLIESGIAMAWGLDVYGFVEEGVSEAQQGILRFSRKAYPRFHRRGLETKRGEFDDYIVDVKERLSKEVRQPYEHTQAVKEVTIYSDGYGAIRSQHTVQFHSDTPDFIANQRYGGGGSAPKALIFPRSIN
jgi:hypothetical protein